MERSQLARPDLLDPGELDSLGGLELIARGVVEGFVAGLHQSPHRGFSVEFAEHRPYHPGDDLRFVDWKMYSRSDRFYVKQFEEETNLIAQICLDASRSMDWRSRQNGLLTKLEYGKRIAASLALLLVRQGDAAGLVCFADDILQRLPARGTLAGWAEMVRALSSLAPGRLSDAENALTEVAVRLRRRGLVVVISDLLVDEATLLHQLKQLRYRGHEVLVVHVLDPGERELPGTGDAIFVEPETGDEVAARSAELRSEYREAVDAAIDEWNRACGEHGVDYHTVTTDQPLGLTLAEYLHTRSRLS